MPKLQKRSQVQAENTAGSGVTSISREAAKQLPPALTHPFAPLRRNAELQKAQTTTRNPPFQRCPAQAHKGEGGAAHPCGSRVQVPRGTAVQATPEAYHRAGKVRGHVQARAADAARPRAAQRRRTEVRVVRHAHVGEEGRCGEAGQRRPRLRHTIMHMGRGGVCKRERPTLSAPALPSAGTHR